MSFFNGISDTDVFKLMDILTVNDASALIAGCNPIKVQEQWDNNELYYYIPNYINNGFTPPIANSGFTPPNADMIFTVALKSLCHVITRGILKADIVANTMDISLHKSDLQKDWIATHGIDTKRTTLTRDDLKEWLENRGVYPPLLFPNGRKNDYLNPEHENYSPKLAVCVKAWEYAQTAIPQGQTVKQMITDWIVENSKDLGLENTGETTIKELASIANWDTKGGQAKKKPTPPLEIETDNQEITQNLLTVHQKLGVDLPQETYQPYNNEIHF